MFEQILTPDEREKIKKKNIKDIKKQLSSVDADVIKLNEHLIEEAAVYAMTLTEINMIIERDGIVDIYKNGANQYGTKKSVAAELKPKYTMTYQSLVRQLMELLPSQDDNDAAAELMEFLNGGGKN